MKQFSLLTKIAENTGQTRSGNRFAKKIILLMLPFFLLAGHSVLSQCNNTAAFGTAAAPTGGGIVTITTCAFGGEYSTVTGATAGATYQFNATGGAGNYITIRQGTPGGTVLGFGFAPITVVCTVSGSLYLHYNTNAACGTDASCHTGTVQCLSCVVPPPAPCNNPTSFGSATINTAGSVSTISTCSFAGEYSTISGAVAGQILRFTSSNATDMITVRSGTPGGPVLAFGTTPLSFSNTFTGTVYAHWNTPGCGSQATCRTTTVQCTSCLACLPLTITPPAATICAGSVQLLTASHSNPPDVGTQTTNSGAVNVPILDVATVSSTMAVSNIPAGAVVTGVSVLFNITHTWDSDLIISLKAPNNQVLNLVNQRGGSGDNFTNTVISSASTTSLATGTPPFTGTFMADGNAANPPVGFTQTAATFPPLYTTPNGNWALGIRDAVGGDVGILSNWSVTINYTAPLLPVWAPLTELYTDAAGTVPYTGTPSATVYAAPTATRTYSATLATAICTPAPTFVTITTNPAPAAPTVTPNPAAVCPGGIRRLDATTGLGGPGSCNTSSGAINVVVPDANPAGAISNLVVSCVPAGATVTGVAVTFNMTHTWDADMIINLRSPNNQVLNLVNARGGSGDNFVNTTLSSASSVSLATGTPPFTGTFMADGNAANPPTGYTQTTATFPAMYTVPNGTWTLAMRDNAGGDIGILTSWSILINYNVPPAPVGVVWAPITELFTDAAATIPYVANTPLATVYCRPSVARTYTAVIPSVPCPSLPAIVPVSLAPNPAVVIIADPGSVLCQGDPALLTVRLGSSTPVGTLYNQAGAAGNGSPSQVFEPANAAFTSQSADDFVVPAGSTWTVTRVTADGIGAGNPTSVNVFFYNNSAANLPGTLVASYPNLLTFVRTGGNYNVTLPAGLVLGAGQYWVSVQVNMSFATGGQWFWGNFGAANILNQYAWQNPGGGFGTPCTSWGYGATGCAVGGGVNRNNIFSIVGTSLADGGPLPAGYTFLWSPAAGLSSTTSNPVAASPMTTTTYTVNVTTPDGCLNQASILMTVNLRPTVTSHPVSRTNCAGTTATFTVAGTGTNLAYQWQVSTTGCGGPWTNLTNTAPYSGVNTATLDIASVTALMTGYGYRCVLTGVCAPIGTANISNCAVLTVNPLPVVTVTPTIGCGGVAGLFGTALTASGANTYTWAPLTGLYTDAAALVAYTGGNAATVYAAPTTFTVYTVTGSLSTTGCSNTATAIINYTPPPPTVTPSSVTMCLGDAAVKLKSSSAQSFSATFNSGALSLAIPDGPATWPQTVFPGVSTPNLAVSGIPANATITGMSVRLNLTHTYIADMVIVLKGPNNQVLNLSANINKTGGPGANFINTIISSASTTPLSAGLPPYTGTFQPDAVGATYVALGFTFPGGPTSPAGYIPTVSAFSGLYSVPNGNWTMGIYDWGAGDLGTLTNWELKIDYIVGVPATPAVWTPAAGLFSDAAALTPYVAGTAVDSVWTRPVPSGVYTYEARVNSLPPPPASFTNPAAITINASGPGAPYPSNLTVSNLPPAGVTVSSVLLNGISHTWSDDVDILLQSPSGQNVILMSDVGGATVMNGANYTFSDAGNPMGTVANPSGTYRPTNLVGTLGVEPDQWPAPGPGTVAQPAPALSTFTGNMNGVWKLFVVDDFAGDQGSISGGYTINFNMAPTPCTSPPRTVIVTVNQPTVITTQPVSRTVCTDKVATFTVAAGGSGPFSYQWQVSTNNGNTWTNIANGGVYAGATTTTLTISGPPVSMSGNQYRCVVTGAAPCAAINSFQVVLTVNPLPTIVISASPYTSLFPGLVTTLSSTVSPNAASSYTWLRNGLPVAGSTGTLNVDADGIGDYTLRVTDVKGCTNTSNMITIKDSVSGKCFIYPNPNSGQFQVRYYSVANNVLPRSLTVYDAKGERVITQYYTVGRPYDRMDVDMRKYGKGLYWVEIGDMNGNRLTMCRIVIQ